MPKVNWSVGGGSNCGCCGCDAVFQSLTASLAHHGFAPFSCDGSPRDYESPTRYLTIRYSGLGTTGCGEYKKHGKATRSYTIDPMTGYQCIGGDPSPSFWCASSATPQCTPTSKKWDCGTISNSQKALNCGKGEDEDGNPLRLTLEENLSDAYTLDDVESNVDALLSQNPIDDNSMPPGVAGTVVTGSGHSIITWGGAAATSAYFYKGNGQVMKTKLRVTFPTATSYKLITKDETGAVISEEKREATAGRVITVPPPSSPGYTTVEPSCAFPSIPTTLDCNVSGNYTTKRRVFRDASGDEIPPPPCNLFIGPDCEQYNTKTVVVSGSSQALYTNYSIGEPMGYTEPDIDEKSRRNGNFSHTYKETACPYSTECISKNVSWSLTEEAYGYTDTCECEIGGCDEDQTCAPENCGPYQLSASCEHVACNKEESTYESQSYSLGEGTNYVCAGGLSFTRERSSSQSISISGNVVTSSQSSSFNFETEGLDCGGFNDKGTQSSSSNCTVTVTYSNEEGAAAEESDGPTQGWETESLPWCSGGQTEGCVSFTGCVERYSRATYRTQSNATVSCQGSFTAPEAPEGEQKYFETWFHYYTVEDRGQQGIEFNLGRTGCRIRTVRAFTTRVGTTSSGGQVSVSGPSISLSASEGETKCLIGPTAYTYALPADNSPE